MKQGDRTQLKILQAANELFYHRGYNHTSFSDIVGATGLSKGNITYHFKNKQMILKGIITLRINQIEMQLAKWEEQTENPKERLKLFCDMLVSEQGDLQQFGCPVGTLTSELAKNDPDLYQVTLPLFEAYRNWLMTQYQTLGEPLKEAKEKAMHLLAKVQGIALITQVFRDKTFLQQEISRLKLEMDH